MGIRGAWSLISKDPSRFGHRWLLKKNENGVENNSTIFLDGPSMLYYVACNYSTENHRPTLGLLSPSSIYTGTVEFMQALIEVSGPQGELHIVMDGLSPKEKLQAQIQRMADQASDCDIMAKSCATTNGSSCKTLPLFAEAAMIEALEDILKSIDSVHLHRPLHGEAETYIARWLDRNNQHTESVFIFSDDTDFLVYPSCPGIIPFRSLKFTTIGVDKCLTGYFYLRSKFMVAFFPTLEGEEGHIMSVVAALAGCDYRLDNGKENLLQNARTFVTQSDIGGLRQRQRNIPTGMAALTAILRFVAHYYVQSQKKERSSSSYTSGDTTWCFSLADAIHSEGKGKQERRDNFIEALQDIHEIYFSSRDQQDECPPHSILWNDLVRFVEWGVMYCRPLVETWEGGAISKQIHDRRSKRSKKHLKPSQRRLDQSPTQEEGVDSASHSEFNIRGGVSTWTRSASIWTLPHFCTIRVRVYSYMLLQGLLTKESISSNNKSNMSNCLVSEYMRCGNRHNIEFKKKLVTVTSDSTNDTISTLSSIDDILLWTALGDCILQTEGKGSLLGPDRLLHLTSFMLPSKETLLLYILGTAPNKVMISRQLESDCSEIIEVLSLINVACFHATLAINASFYNVMMSSATTTCTSPDEFDSNPYGIQINKVFRHDLAVATWQGIPEIENFRSNRDTETSHVIDILDTVFGRMTGMYGVQCETQLDLECWKKKTFQLWKKWLQVHDNLEHNRNARLN